MSQPDLLHWRADFPILSQSTYLISNSLGAMPRAVYDKLREFAERAGYHINTPREAAVRAGTVTIERQDAHLMRCAA